MDAAHSHFVESQARHKQIYNAYFHFYKAREQTREIYDPGNQKNRNELTESSEQSPVNPYFLISRSV